jgi:hypothetical protein
MLLKAIWCSLRRLRLKLGLRLRLQVWRLRQREKDRIYELVGDDRRCGTSCTDLSCGSRLNREENGI